MATDILLNRLWVIWTSQWTCFRTGPRITVSHCHLFCLTPPPSLLLPPPLSLSLHPPGRPLPPTSSSSLLPPSLPSSSSAPHHTSPGPSPPIRECQVPLLEKNSTHSHLEPHPDDSYMLRAQPSSTGKRALPRVRPFLSFHPSYLCIRVSSIITYPFPDLICLVKCQRCFALI